MHGSQAGTALEFLRCVALGCAAGAGAIVFWHLLGDCPLGLAWPVVLAAMAVFAGVAGWWLEWSQKRRLSEAVGTLADFSRKDHCDLDADSLAACFAGVPFSGVFIEVAQRLVQLYEQSVQTEQQQVAAELRTQRIVHELERTRLIFDAMPDVIMVLDSFGMAEMANAAACRLLGTSSEELMQGTRPATAYVRDSELRAALEEDLRHKRLSERVRELKLDADTDEVRTLRLLTRKVGGNDGSREHLIVIARDMTDLQQLRQRHAEFVSAVSHEMKTPLAGIRAYVELLVDGDAEDEETRDQFLETIQCQTDRLQRLIDNLLNLARIEAGVVKVKKDPRPINEILEEAFRIVQPQAEAKQIKLSKELSSLYLPVLGDRDLLLQAAINLLSNAVKYTPSGGQVSVHSRVLGDAVAFEVADTGVGLSEEDRKRVFERFYRVKKDQQMASGTGLGLPLAKHIIEDVHGGTLGVESEVGKGSVFTASLPLSRQHATAAEKQ